MEILALNDWNCMRWEKELCVCVFFLIGRHMLLLLMDNIQLWFHHPESTNHDALVLNMFHYYYMLIFVAILSILAFISFQQENKHGLRKKKSKKPWLVLLFAKKILLMNDFLWFSSKLLIWGPNFRTGGPGWKVTHLRGLVTSATAPEMVTRCEHPPLIHVTNI